MKLNVVFNRDEGILTGAKKRRDSLDWSREAIRVREEKL